MSTHDEPLLVKKRGRGDPYYLPSGNPSKGITQEISMNKQTGEELNIPMKLAKSFWIQ